MSKPFITMFNNKQMAESAYRTLIEYGYHATMIFPKEEKDKFSEINTLKLGGLSLGYLTDNNPATGSIVGAELLELKGLEGNETISNNVGENDYILHKLNQGAVFLTLHPEEENWSAAQEIVKSYNGEIVEDERFINYYQQQYRIDLQNEETYEVGTFGYPYDMLDDNAYIDPNIGIGNYDLLEPIFKPEDQEMQH